MGRYAGTSETSVTIRNFRGINQQDGVDNINPEYAAYAENCDTRGGLLCPTRAPLPILSPLPAPIGTLACFHRRYHVDPKDADVLVAVADGKIYARCASDADWRKIGEGYARDDFDFVTYEANLPGYDAPIDVLIMSNARDGMIFIYGNDFHIEAVPTPKKFGAICRHAERIWGSAIEDEPDMLMYSAPFDPKDWASNEESPEDGAGDILQPSWDGDRFIALRNWGEYLLAFKCDTVWRVLGTDPGQYVMRQQHGEDGAVVENTIAISRDSVFMLYERGISVYEGGGVQPLHEGALRGIFARMHRPAMSKATAICYQYRYLLALPLDGSAINNAVIEYDTVHRTWMLRTGLSIAAFAKYGERLLCTSAETPGRILAMDEGTAQPMRWESPYLDLGAKNTQKSNFRVYMTAEADAQTGICVALNTERKAKEKRINLSPGHRGMRCVRLANRGRRWRLVLTAPGGTMWRLSGGLQVDLEVDAD